MNKLSNEQNIAFQNYLNGENVFITGPGGSGKSTLIKKIYHHSLKCGKNIKVTALTGCAAILLDCNAKTIHSWAGIGTANYDCPFDNYIKKIKKNKIALNNWRKTQILVIDEVSMLSLKLFELLNYIAQKIRYKYNIPFGGIQVIMCGDFYQLPPIGNNDDIKTKQFCFESELWNFVFKKNCIIELIKIYRQNDETFMQILNQIRNGKIKRKTHNILTELVGKKLNPNFISQPTKLYPTKSSVEYINNYNLENLPGDIHEYKMKYLNSSNVHENLYGYSNNKLPIDFKIFADNLLCEKELKLKVGAQVMSIINISASAMDKKKFGSIIKTHINVNNDDNDDIKFFENYADEEDNERLVICNGSQGIVTKFCEVTGYPIIKFNNGIETIMEPHIWQSELNELYSISQIPLILCWALTIHKSQGSTLDCAEIDVGSGIFECGQTYVALSRVKNLDGLYLTSYDVTKIKINKKVNDFYENLKKSLLEKGNKTN